MSLLWEKYEKVKESHSGHQMLGGNWRCCFSHTPQGWNNKPQSNFWLHYVTSEWWGVGYSLQGCSLRGQDLPQLVCERGNWDFFDNHDVHAAWHGTDKNICHIIDLNSLIDHDDHCGVGHWVFVHNGRIYGTGVGVQWFLVKPHSKKVQYVYIMRSHTNHISVKKVISCSIWYHTYTGITKNPYNRPYTSFCIPCLH